MPVRTIVPPGAELIIKDKRSPTVTVRSPIIGDRITVCRKDFAIWMLVKAGRTRSDEIRRIPTMGMATITMIPDRTLIR